MFGRNRSKNFCYKILSIYNIDDKIKKIYLNYFDEF